ncbi:unnamed protein product [Rotaria sordida]|uniref:Ig-like domain-containing protein n=1 Tax=Rotaria sordida TaxID=392033 RepID=A0A818LTU9_9BILA|nr:unnamed protein product [Rotaria sordida]
MVNTQLYFIFLTVLNIFVSSNAKYVRSPGNDVSLTAALKHSLELKCIYQGLNDGGGFTEWYKDGAPVSSEKPGHYAVHNSDTESKLTIKVFVKADADVKIWSVKTTKSGFEEPLACQFGPIPIRPAPQYMDTGLSYEQLDTSHESVRRVQGDRLSLRCVVEPSLTEEESLKNIKWEYSPDDREYSKLHDGAAIPSGDQLVIDTVDKTHRGYYRCSVDNVSFTVLLRVKDRLAALWPFLGIVGVVLVLVIIILIFEKRERSTRKATIIDDDENDHANDPLVRLSNKPSDGENKKRAVKV